MGHGSRGAGCLNGIRGLSCGIFKQKHEKRGRKGKPKRDLEKPLELSSPSNYCDQREYEGDQNHPVPVSVQYPDRQPCSSSADAKPEPEKSVTLTITNCSMNDQPHDSYNSKELLSKPLLCGQEIRHSATQSTDTGYDSSSEDIKGEADNNVTSASPPSHSPEIIHANVAAELPSGNKDRETVAHLKHELTHLNNVDDACQKHGEGFDDTISLTCSYLEAKLGGILRDFDSSSESISVLSQSPSDVCSDEGLNSNEDVSVNIIDEVTKGNNSIQPALEVIVPEMDMSKAAQLNDSPGSQLSSLKMSPVTFGAAIPPDPEGSNELDSVNLSLTKSSLNHGIEPMNEGDVKGFEHGVMSEGSKDVKYWASAKKFQVILEAEIEAQKLQQEVCPEDLKFLELPPDPEESNELDSVNPSLTEPSLNHGIEPMNEVDMKGFEHDVMLEGSKDVKYCASAKEFQVVLDAEMGVKLQQEVCPEDLKFLELSEEENPRSTVNTQRRDSRKNPSEKLNAGGDMVPPTDEEDNSTEDKSMHAKIVRLFQSSGFQVKGSVVRHSKNTVSIFTDAKEMSSDLEELCVKVIPDGFYIKLEEMGNLGDLEFCIEASRYKSINPSRQPIKHAGFEAVLKIKKRESKGEYGEKGSICKNTLILRGRDFARGSFPDTHSNAFFALLPAHILLRSEELGMMLNSYDCENNNLGFKPSDWFKICNREKNEHLKIRNHEDLLRRFHEVIRHLHELRKLKIELQQGEITISVTQIISVGYNWLRIHGDDEQFASDYLLVQLDQATAELACGDSFPYPLSVRELEGDLLSVTSIREIKTREDVGQLVDIPLHCKGQTITMDEIYVNYTSGNVKSGLWHWSPNLKRQLVKGDSGELLFQRDKQTNELQAIASFQARSRCEMDGQDGGMLYYFIPISTTLEDIYKDKFVNEAFAIPFKPGGDQFIHNSEPEEANECEHPGGLEIWSNVCCGSMRTKSLRTDSLYSTGLHPPSDRSLITDSLYPWSLCKSSKVPSSTRASRSLSCPNFCSRGVID